MIDIDSERLLTIAQAADLRPPGRRGRPTHPSTIYRWIGVGVRGIKLEAIRFGGCLYTSREALQRFADRLTTPSPASTSPGVPAGTSRRDRAQERAGRMLDLLGI